MNRFELGNAIYVASHLEGEFVLRSGQKSEQYFDKYQFESDPRIMRSLAETMSTMIPRDTEILAGLETGGIPLATAISLYSLIPQVIVRRSPKEYGTRKQVEGPEIDGKKVCIVEDIVTTGGFIAETAGILREMHAGVEYAVCVVDRSGGPTPRLDEVNIALKSVFTARELEDSAKMFRK